MEKQESWYCTCITKYTLSIGLDQRIYIFQKKIKNQRIYIFQKKKKINASRSEERRVGKECLL